MRKTNKKEYDVHKHYNVNEIIGLKSHKLEVIGINYEISSIKRRLNVDCICECGKTKCIDFKNFRSGNSKTCGMCNFISFGDFLIEKYGETAIDKYWSIKNKHDPFKISRCSHTKVWIKCDKTTYHDDYYVSCLDFYNGVRCPYCARKNGKSVHRLDSFAQYHIDNTDENFLEKYWDYEKNTVNPFEICPTYEGKIWIKCQEKDYHGSYSLKCASFTNGTRCSMCSGRTVHKNDSLGVMFPKTLKIWSDKNDKTPYDYSPNSAKVVWWKCPEGKHDDYQRKISSSNTQGFRCASCTMERQESLLQEKVRLYISNMYSIKHEHNCSIVPRNPKTNCAMPFDNEVVDLKLIIEVHGEQHYRLDKFNSRQANNNNTSPEYELHKRKLYDRYKKYVAWKNGYNYLEIPYWSDNSHDEWRMLIDRKINTIKKEMV